MVGEENRHQMMQNLFGDQSEEEEEEEVESEHESNRQPGYASDEGDRPVGTKVAHEVEVEEEGQGEAEMESEGDHEHDQEQDQDESEGEKDQSSHEVEIEDRKAESEGRESESDEKEEYEQRVVTSRRREPIESGESEKSEHNRYTDNDNDNVDEEVNQATSPQGQEKEEAYYSHTAPEIRDVFGDSDEDEEQAEEYPTQNQTEEEPNRSPMEEENYDTELRPEDVLADEYERYESDEERIETKAKEKPMGPPIELEVPFKPPPARPDRMNMIKVSNIMGIDSRPFDPKTYVEEETFVTDESGSRKRIRLENNIVRWRKARNPDGSPTIESNARFVRWSDGSLQLLIGSEVLDISEQSAEHDQAHLFLRHGKGILQSQGRILKKMRFMPSSLSSNSHRLLTALVDSRHKKVYKVKNCVTDIDPEREKEQKERAANQNIKATELLNKKKEKVNRKYMPTTRRERQLSPGFLEDALDEEDEDYDNRRSGARRRFDDDLEMEARAERRIINAKKGNKDIPRKSSFSGVKSSRRADDYYEESEYETEGEEESPTRRRAEEEEDEEPEYEDSEEEEEERYEQSDEEPKHKGKEASGSGLKRKKIESDEEVSPPRKVAAHRRMAIVYDSDEE